jgi:hypothetical protein
MGRRRDPGPGLGVAVPEALEQPVVDRLLARGDQHLVAALQREDVEEPLPVGPVGIGRRVAVMGVVEREPVRHGGALRVGRPRRRERLGQVQPAARPGDVRVAAVLQVPVHARQHRHRSRTGHMNPAGAAGDLEPLGAPDVLERDLAAVPWQQPPHRLGRRSGRVGPRSADPHRALFVRCHGWDVPRPQRETRAERPRCAQHGAPVEGESGVLSVRLVTLVRFVHGVPPLP